VHVACGAVLCGHVSVGSDSHVGAGATLKEGVTLGERSVVGAGAVVLRSFAPDCTLVGLPAREMKARP
jgi:UDP-perosamine 4-acetyltransferase